MPGGPSHRQHTLPPMRSRARRIGRRRPVHPQPIFPHICMISVIMAALALSLPFCDSESSPTGHAMASIIAEKLEGERAIAYAALNGEISTASADLRFRSPWRPWQRRVEGAAAGAGVASARSSNCACSSCGQALARHAQDSITTLEAPRHPAEDRVRQARRVAAFVSPGGRPLARGNQEIRDGSPFSHRVSSGSAAASPRPAAAQQPQTPSQRPHQCSTSTSNRCHLEARGISRSKPGRSRSQLQASCCCSGDGDGLFDSPSPSAVTFGDNVHPRRRYSSTELPRLSETYSFLSTKKSPHRASHRASQRVSQQSSRTWRDATALRASAGDSSVNSSAGSSERGAPPPKAEQQQRSLASVRAPLLVTIGPQCAGKTTLLKALSSGRPAGEGRGGRPGDSRGRGGDSVERSAVSVRDVAIDDHPSVYHQVSIDALVDGCAKDSEKDEEVAGRRLSDRLREPGCLETRLVALRLLGRISAEEFTVGIEGYGGQASSSALVALGDAVESAVSDEARVSTPTVDVFVRENLFPVAISSAKRSLEVAVREERGMVAWGNTNTQARDFRGALEQAELTSRPVRFVRWGHELPFLSLEELCRRNVYRFASTGRYVETAAIETALARVAKLYASTSGGDSVQLALAAGFEMDASGGVHSVSSAGSAARFPHAPPARSGGRQARPGGREGSRARSSGGGGGAISGTDSGGISSSSSSGGSSSGGGGGGGGSDKNPGRTASSGGFQGVAVSSLQSLPPPIARPLPVGRLTDGADRRSVVAYASAPPLGLAQEWTPGGGARLDRGSGVSTSWNARGWGRGREAVPSTVMFGNEWGRKRGWRRSGYSEDDIDPMMASCFFRKPANSTGVLKRFDTEDGGGADFEEMDLVRRIKSFRQRR